MVEVIADYALKGVDVDQVFARAELNDRALTAAVRVSARFDPAFPGWQLYRRIVAGVTLFDTELQEWAESTALMLARSTKRGGRLYVREASVSEDWVRQAARDGLDHAVCGRFPATLEARAELFSIHWTTYRKIRDPMALCIRAGFDHFGAELRTEYFRVRREDIFGEKCGEPIPASRLALGRGFKDLDLVGDGNFRTASTPNPDTL